MATSSVYRVITCCLLLLPRVVVAQPPSATAQSQLPALKQLTLEELLDVDVTLPLRRPERVSEAAAAVTVLTSEDIRRGGALNLAETLRFAPGLFVGRLSASSWVISARGFASTSSNKLLVMLDGRTVYSPLFSGVFWDVQDTFLLDLDRIEVIRGPGATLWGSNAVNGVINVVSRTAAETQGGLVSVSGGAEERLSGSARYGGRVGSGFYRIYGKYFDRDDARQANGSPAKDWQKFGQGGFRLDFGTADHSAVVIQGDLYASRAGLLNRASDLESAGANILARWSRQFAPGNQLQAQFYYDRTSRMVPEQFREHRGTYDFDLQHRFRPAPRHALGWGVGYRASRDDTEPTVLLFFDPEDRTTHLVSAFAQDEITLSRDWTLTVGSKFEHNVYTGVEVQPTARLRWTPQTRQTVWGAVSRAVRLPTRLDTDVRVTNAGRVTIAGNPAFESETVVAYEGGYRVAPVSGLALDMAVFHQRYDDLRTQEAPTDPGPVLLGNGLNVRSSGLELIARAQPRANLTVTGSYAYLTKRLSLDPSSRDIPRGTTEAVDPAHQILGQIRVTLPAGLELDGYTRWISELPGPGTPAYTEATIRAGWRINNRFEVSIVGRDLLHDAHLEFVSPTAPAQRTMLERAVWVRLTVAF